MLTCIWRAVAAMQAQGNEPAAFVPREGGCVVEYIIELRKLLTALASVIRALKTK